MSLSIFDAARRAPDSEALVCDGARLTFAGLAARVQRRNAELRNMDVDSAQPRPVALIVDGSLPMFEYLFLLLALGVPVLPIHPRLTAIERDALLRLASISTLLDPSRAAPVESLAQLPWSAEPIPDRRALAYVPSSGTTGAPKLVELSRAAFVALARADALRVPPMKHDRALLCLPLSHVGGLSVVIRALLAARCCVAFSPGAAGLLASVPELARCLVSERISLLSVVPAVLARLLRDAPRLAREAPLRAVLVGGQACSPDLFEAAQQQQLPILTSYGLTETCSQVCSLAYPPPAGAPVRASVVGVGFPLPGIELRVVDGLIEVRGQTLFTGYVGQPSPFGDDGFFNTGDRGEFDPQLGLFVYGRASELIITGGENVDPTEVEHALLACGGVEAACVFGLPDPHFGELVAAAFEPAFATAADEAALREGLKRRLAPFKHPRAWCLFERLPRLPSGKLDRAAIRSEARARLRLNNLGRSSPR